MAALSSCGDDSEDPADEGQEEIAKEVAAEEPTETEEEEEPLEREEKLEEEETLEEAPAEEETTETLSQKNAVGKAEDYLNYTAFSKSGLVEQLEYEGFSNEDATYAVNKVEADWKQQAVLKAEDYLNYSSFSRSGLIEQLEFEGFSNEEATYAVDEIGL